MENIMRKMMKYRVKYEDNQGNDCIICFDSEEEVEQAIIAGRMY